MVLLIGQQAPHFKAKAVINKRIVSDFSLNCFLGKNIVLFFYPLDFTFVCPTELHAFQDNLESFEKRNTQVIGCSVDSCYAHSAWLSTPKHKGGIEGVTYPLISDITKEIASKYGVLNEQEGIAYRGLFIIDTEGVVCRQEVNDFPLGRSVDEVLRSVDAMLFHQKHGEVCPANWKEGQKSMVPTQEGLEKYFAHSVK